MLGRDNVQLKIQSVLCIYVSMDVFKSPPRNFGIFPTDFLLMLLGLGILRVF